MYRWKEQHFVEASNFLGEDEGSADNQALGGGEDDESIPCPVMSDENSQKTKDPGQASSREGTERDMKVWKALLLLLFEFGLSSGGLEEQSECNYKCDAIEHNW